MVASSGIDAFDVIVLNPTSIFVYVPYSPIILKFIVIAPLDESNEKDDICSYFWRFKREGVIFAGGMGENCIVAAIVFELSSRIRLKTVV